MIERGESEMDSPPLRHHPSGNRTAIALGATTVRAAQLPPTLIESVEVRFRTRLAASRLTVSFGV